jgi:hypothetical protein
MKLKKVYLSTSLLLVLVGLFSSCSVVMAANRRGTNIDNVQKARTRGEMISQGAQVISSERLPCGTLIEVYQFKKESGSAARAFMHGLLDVSTCGIWEVVGTPMEACLTNNEYYTFRVYFDENEYVTRVELM